MKTISGQELLDAVMGVPGWGVSGGELVREFTFKDFVAAVAFVNQVATLAEAAQHHPDMDIRYNRVRLALVTHDAGGITANDLELALKVNGLLE
jgi:4a-hydroxytetrahydrobiopterin dehydratase